MKQYWIVLLVAVLGMTGMASELDVSLCRFDSAETLARWKCRRGARFTQAKWPDQHPGFAGKLEFLKHRKEYDSWPAIVLKSPHIAPTDWRMAEFLQFQAYAPEAGSFSIQLNGSGGQRAKYKVALEKGRNQCKIALANLEFAISEIHLFTSKPSEDTVYYIGPMSLKFRDIELLKSELAALRSQASEHAESLRLWRVCEAGMEGIGSGGGDGLSEKFSRLEDLMKELKHSISHANALKQASPDDTLPAFWLSPMEKVARPRHTFSSPPVREYRIDVARGEGEGAQIAVFPRMDFADCSVKISKLPVNSAGAQIAADAFQLHPVGFIFCKPAAYDTSRSGWLPDPILEYSSSVPLTRECWQTWWFDVSVPETQGAGLYQGEVTISAGDEVRTLPIQILVRNFALPRGVPYDFVAGLGNFTLNDREPASVEERKRWKFAAYDLFLNHRVNPDDLYCAVPPSAEEIQYKLDRGAGKFNILYLKGFFGQGKPFHEGTKKAILDKLEKAVAEYRRLGLYQYAYLYGYDEAGPEHWPLMRELFGEIKQRYPDLPIVTTAYDTTYGLTSGTDSLVDVWVPMIDSYAGTAGAIKGARARGKKVWWYIACSPLRPYPNWFIEYDAMDARMLMGVMCWKFRPDGFLYYRLGGWQTQTLQNGEWIKKSREKYLDGAPLTNWDSYSWCNYNGDGNLIYPTPQGPIGSLRLKNIRDGLDDFLYLKTLQDLRNQQGHLMPEQWRNEVDRTLTIQPELVAGITEFSRNPADLMQFRSQLAALIEACVSIHK